MDDPCRRRHRSRSLRSDQVCKITCVSTGRQDPVGHVPTVRSYGRGLEAIQEFENVSSFNSDVWDQFCLFHAVQSEKDEAAIAFTKATVLEPYHPASLTRIGKSYFEAGSLKMAESMLDATTRNQGWDNAEAWFCLGKVFEVMNRLARAKECLWYALDLEASHPVRRYTEALPRFLD